MTKLQTLSLAAMLAASLAGATRRADAGPSVIRDETLKDVGTTPVLGRGYSVATNTFQSICMKEVVKTKPSYDFKYTFTEITDSQAKDIKQSGQFEAQYGANYGFFKVNGRMKGSFKSNTETKKESVNIVVTIDVDTYYASMDESKGELADTAVSLVKGDLPAFFDACGMYYVRSINRNSKIFALFQFSSVSEKEDKEFAAELEAEIRGWGWSGSMKSSMSSASKSSSEHKDLRIVTNASGLGKITGTTLLAYDLASFRQAVLSAFTATQHEDVGRVTSIEVVPWVEHLQFQSLMLGNANYTTDGKRNMVVNSEFLAEVDRSARAKLNVFYKSKQCRGMVEADFRFHDEKGKSQWMTVNGVNLGEVNVKSHRKGGLSRPLKTLWETLTPEKEQVLYNEYDAFMYGGKDDLPVVIQDGRRTYRYEQDSSPLIPPTGENRSDWAGLARAALDAKGVQAPDGWVLAHAKAYLRGNGQDKAAYDQTTVAELIKPLLADNSTDLKTPFTEKLVYLEGAVRKTFEIEIKNKTDLENGVWRRAFNNPGAVIESKDGWFAFAAAAILDNDEFASKWVTDVSKEVAARTEIVIPADGTLNDLASQYADQVAEKLKSEPRAYPSFAALAQGAVVRILQGGTDHSAEVNVDPIVTAYLLKQLLTYGGDYLSREKKDPKESDWDTAKKIYQQYKRLASQGGSMSLGSVGFYGSAEYIGAARCVRDLLRDNRFLKDSYRNIESCRRVESQLGTIRSTVVEDYCLPQREDEVLE